MHPEDLFKQLSLKWPWLARLHFSWLLPLALVWGVLGLVGITSSFWMYHTSSQSVVSQVAQPETIDTALHQPEAALVVEVSGAVATPGLYRVTSSDRVGDAITLAGGWTSELDQAWAAQNLNLAQPVTDGLKIYLPRKGEAIELQKQSVEEISIDSSSATGNLLSINQASLAELDSLPEIGLKRAQSIIDQRPYTQLDQLVEREVLPASLFERVAPLLTL